MVGTEPDSYVSSIGRRRTWKAPRAVDWAHAHRHVSIGLAAIMGECAAVRRLRPRLLGLNRSVAADATGPLRDTSQSPGNVCSLLAILIAINGSTQATTGHVRLGKLQADALPGVVQS